MPACRVCDAPVEPADRFCSRCGHDLAVGFVPLMGDDAAVVIDGTTPPGRSGPSPRILTALAVAVIAVVAVLVAVALTGSDDPAGEQAQPTPADTGDGDGGGDAGSAAAFDPTDGASDGDGRAPPGDPDAPRRTETRPGPTPAPPVLGEESGWTIAVRTDRAVLVVDLDTGERRTYDVASPPFEGPGPRDTIAVVGSELWVLTDDALRSFDLSTLAEVDPSYTSSEGPVDLSRVVGLVAGPSPTDGVVTVDDDGIHTVHRRGGEATPFIVPPGFDVFGPHRRGIVLTRPEIGGAWLLGDGEPRRITVGRPLALSPAGLLALECDDDLSCAFSVLDVADGSVVRSVPAGIDPNLPDTDAISVLSPDGTLHLLAGQGTTEQVLDLDDGARIPGLVTGIVTAGAFSPDSGWLFLGGDAADRALLTAVPVDFSLPQRAIATDVDLGAARQVLVFAAAGLS